MGHFSSRTMSARQRWVLLVARLKPKPGATALRSRILSGDELQDASLRRVSVKLARVGRRDAKSPESIRAYKEKKISVHGVFATHRQRRQLWIHITQFASDEDAQKVAQGILDSISYLGLPKEVRESPIEKVTFEGYVGAMTREVEVITWRGTATDRRFSGSVGACVLTMGFGSLDDHWEQEKITELVQRQVSKLSAFV
jgi:hypothetical protein